MKSILAFAFLTLITVTSCETGASEESESNQKDGAKSMKLPTAVSKKLESPQQARAKQEEQDALFKKECETMDIYLTHKISIFPHYAGGNKRTFSGMKLKFDLFNAASLARFENIQLEVKFITRSGSVVKKETYTIDEPLGPSQSAVHTITTDISEANYLAFTETEVTIVGAECK